MMKPILAVVALLAAPALYAQTPAAPAGPPPCPAGTSYAAIRHSIITPGQWTTFEKAVAHHQAWYKAKGNGTTTGIVRVLNPRGSATPLSDAEAVTITRYDATHAPKPHDAAWDAFVAEYKASSTVKDEIAVCLPN